MMNAHETIAALLDENQVASVTSIISLLSDGKLFEQRLNALKAIAENADKKMKDASALADKYATAEKMLADATAMLMKQNDMARELDARAVAAADREQKLSAAEKAGREEHTRIEVALAAREKRVEQREQLLAEGQTALAQAKSHVDAQITSLDEARKLAESLRGS
jgi:hypothetical protein